MKMAGGVLRSTTTHGLGGDAMRAGLPFAGIPPEVRQRAQKILDAEPQHRDIKVDFRHSQAEQTPLTLFQLLAPHRLSLTLALVLVIVETLGTQAGPLLAKFGIDEGVMKGEFRVLVVVSLLYVGILAFNASAAFARISWTGRLAEKLMLELRIRCFSHLQRLSIDFYAREMAGRLMSRMTSDIEALTALLYDGVVNLVVQALTLVFATAVLLWLNVKLAAITIVFAAPAMFLLTFWFRKASGRGYAAVRERVATVLADFQENLTGIRVVSACNRQHRNIRKHFEVLSRYRDANFYTTRTAAIFDSSSNFIAIASQGLIVLVGGNMFLRGELTIGELTAFILYLVAFFAPIQQLAQLYDIYQRGQAALSKLRDLLNTQPSVYDSTRARGLAPLEGDIVFKNVSFAYREGQPVLRNVDLRIKPGETVAFVGHTGAGKSTMAKLITRFYDPSCGQVLIDGQDIREVTLASLRRQLGYVPQEPFLFEGTVRDNIAFARPKATDEEVLEACRIVGIADVVQAMPQAFHTHIHERGVSLSSGERQLLALARAFVARPRLVILDEATSNLDPGSESKIQRALDLLLEGRTAVIIAHRLTTAMRADRIAVFDKGRLIECGSPSELLALQGRYAQMHAAWAQYVRPPGE